MLVLLTAVLAGEPCWKTCKPSMLHFSKSKPSKFVVGTNLALKRLTYHMPALHAALLAHNPPKQLLRAARRPILIDIGAAAYGDVQDADGSDSLLLATRFAQAGQPVDVHAFEMQADMAARLVKSARKHNLTGYEVHNLGVGSAIARLPVASPAGKKRTLALIANSTRKRAALPARCGANVGRCTVDHTTLNSLVNVTTLDLFAADFDRPIFYIKTGTQHTQAHASTPKIHTPEMHTPERHTPEMHTPERHTPEAHTSACMRGGARYAQAAGVFGCRAVCADTEGHEPEVLRGMHSLLRAAPPLFLSFEYGGGWSSQLGKLSALKASQPARGTLRWARDELGDGGSLRELVGTLARHGYAVFLLHQEGLVRIDGPWWDEFYELALLRDSQVPSWHDVFAAQRGPPLRALLATFHVKLLPCMPRHRPADCRASPPLATTLGPGCQCLGYEIER